MPKVSVRRRRRAQGGCLTFAIAALSIAAVALIAAIVISRRLPASPAPVDAPAPTAGQYVDAGDPDTDDAHRLVLKADSYNGDAAPAVTAQAGPTATPEPTPEPTFNPAEPYALVRPQPTEPGYLPVFKKANTDRCEIAITVDECSGVTITKSFAEAAASYGAKLTLFPSGDNVMKKGMAEVMRTCFFDLGFEIENRCYSAASRLYQLNDPMMASEIWKQAIAVSYVLNVKYTPHFLRLYGGDGENDLRTHTYLMQEGYLGIAAWTYNGGTMNTNRIGNNLAPGNIYFFKTTNSDLNRMKLLMQEAKAQGYDMVTLNRLFGYDENEAIETENSILSETLPVLKNPAIPYYFMKAGDCTWATYLLQARLIQLGYLEQGSADGVFGSGTAAALGVFQAKLGLAATGAADVTTQEKLFAVDAPPA